MSHFSLLLLFSLLSVPAFASTPQLSCTRTDKGTQQQLAITPNALGTYDVSLHTQADGRQPQQTWLALQLDCEVRGKDGKAWHCAAAQHKPHSPHADSKLQSHLVQDDDAQLEISITSPLLPEGKASYRFARQQCTSQPPAIPSRTTSYSCMAHFSGAHYNPNQGDCVEGEASGCSNPFPYSSRNDCRSALKL